MIEWIEFQNYKALRNARLLPLGRFTLIVGANGSGKSTALNAVFSLRDAPERELKPLAGHDDRSNEGSSSTAFAGPLRP